MLSGEIPTIGAFWPPEMGRCVLGQSMKECVFLYHAFFNAQYFYGLPEAAESRMRALALLWNFCPSSPETVKKHGGQSCPAERLNGKCYADNGLENLLVSGPMNGVEHDPQNLLKPAKSNDSRVK